MTDAEAAWMAGLFEGEGCIWVHGNYVSLQIEMGDEDVVSRFFHLASCGNVTVYTPPNPKHSTMYKWRVADHNNVCRLLTAMTPWFGDRRSYKVLEAVNAYRRRFK